eukprot:1007872_1
MDWNQYCSSVSEDSTLYPYHFMIRRYLVNILIFEWAPTSEMVLSLITKSHEVMTTKVFERSRHLLVIALELIKIRKSYLYPLYKSINRETQRRASYVSQSQPEKEEKEEEPKSLTNLISSAWNWMNTNAISSMVIGNASSLANASNALSKQSVIQSEWQMLKQLKECNGILADVYVMQNKYDIAAQHYILSNRQFLQIRQIKKQTAAQYRLFLEHKSRIEHELNGHSWIYMMRHAKTYEIHSFSTIFVHPFMLSAVQWLDTCIIRETSIHDDTTDPFAANTIEDTTHADVYCSISPWTVTPRNRVIVCATYHLAKLISVDRSRITHFIASIWQNWKRLASL